MEFGPLVCSRHFFGLASEFSHSSPCFWWFHSFTRSADTTAAQTATQTRPTSLPAHLTTFLPAPRIHALKSAREERLNSVANIDREERKKTLFEKQAMMDKTQKAKAKAEKSQASLLNPKRKVCVR